MWLSFDLYGVISILFLIFLEGALSVDNALVLAVTVSHLPEAQQKKALTIGIWSAFLFRFIALFCITTLIKFTWIKIVAGLYLIYLCVSHFFFQTHASEKSVTRGFWSTVVIVELLDIVFSIDSIFAAVGVGQSFAIILVGGIIGIIMMRFAANYFIGLLKKFPWLEQVAYFLVGSIGIKLLVEAAMRKLVT